MQQVKSIIFAIIFAFAASVTMYAQDIIITVKAEKIEAKVTEIDIEVVRYKQYDYQDGPTYIIKKSDIDSIVFQNGQITVFEHLKEESETQPQELERLELQEKNAETIDGKKPIDYGQFKKLNDRQMSNFLKENDAESYGIFHRGELKSSKAKDLFIPGIIFSGIGVASLAIGYVIVPFFLTVSIFGLFVINDWFKNTAPWFLMVGLPALAIGQPFLITSIVLKSQGKALKRQAKSNYEDKFFKYNTTSLNFNFYPNGIGVSLKF